MRTIRDSRVEQLDPAQILTMGIANAENPNSYDKSLALALAMKEMALPNTTIDQIGNTVFVVHRGTGDKANMVVGRMYNAEPPATLVKNVIKHLRNLHEQGITKYQGIIHDDKLLPIIKRVVLTARREGFNIKIGVQRSRQQENVYRILMELVGDN